MNQEQKKGSQTAKNGFQNEKDIVTKFNNWEKDKDVQSWLAIMEYSLTEIEYVNQLDNLEKLYLDYNKISRIEGVSNLSKLQEVTLNYNPLTELSRDEFEKMKLDLFRGNIFVEQTPFFKAIEKTDPELFEEISSTYYPIFD